MCQGILQKAREEQCSPPSCGNTGIPVFFKASPDTEFFRSSHPRVSVQGGDCLHANQLIDMMEGNQLDLIYILDRQGIMIIGIRSWEVREPIVCRGFSLPAALGDRVNQPGGNHGRAVLP